MKKYDETDNDDKEVECVWVLGELKSVLGFQGTLISLSYQELGSALDYLLDAN